MAHIDTALLSKYDIAAPRYTSYPTVPYWTAEAPDPALWLERVARAAQTDRVISLYIHLPFCESLCTYCGCNKHITKNHRVESPYVQSLLQEWAMYRRVLPANVQLGEVHLGGGTPTFFSPENLRQLLEGIFKTIPPAPDAEFSFEAHPWSASEEHLATLADLDFRRISVGVQDFDEDLMKLVNRRQTIASIEQVTEKARALGFTSVNYDLIYGLPKQTPEHIERDAEYLARLLPDRIAFYSYAHVPWLKRSQTAYSEADLPAGAAKRTLYESGRSLLEDLGYRDIGMDHFALPHDSLYQAFEKGSMHRNFMGYTTTQTRLMIGLGASSIGDTWDAFAQTEKTFTAYQEAISAGRLPLIRGHFLSEEDQLLRRHILNLMTRYETSWEMAHPALDAALARLEPMLTDGLVELSPMRVQVTAQGQAFLRNVCMAFDAHYWRRQPQGQLFSRAV